VKYTAKVRQKIIADFCKRHDGEYDPVVFVREVKRKGEDHPAYDWFVWEDTTAAEQYRIWQARVFARNLVIKFSIEEVGRGGKMMVVEQQMPLVISPMAGRRAGGGYLLSNPQDQRHMAMLCAEAAVSLRTWLRRYSAAVHATGVPVRVVEHLAEQLEGLADLDDDEEE
jgi:hypothetical protein